MGSKDAIHPIAVDMGISLSAIVPELYCYIRLNIG